MGFIWDTQVRDLPRRYLLKVEEEDKLRVSG